MGQDYRSAVHGRLGEMLALDIAGEDHFRSVHPDENTGGEVFGGQHLGLAMSAALRTGGGKMPHAMQAFFLRAATASEPVDYRVERTREGRAFAHRRVTASQGGREVFRAEISLHAWEDGQPAHGEPVAVPAWREGQVPFIRLVADNAATVGPVAVRRVCRRDSHDLFLQEPEKGLLVQADAAAMAGWIVPRDPAPAGDDIAWYASVAYLSDAISNNASRLPHSRNIYDGSVLSVSLNHAIWFHARPQPIERIWCTMESPFGGGGLGWSRGSFHDPQGNLLASVVQDALIRRADTGETGQ